METVQKIVYSRLPNQIVGSNIMLIPTLSNTFTLNAEIANEPIVTTSKHKSADNPNYYQQIKVQDTLEQTATLIFYSTSKTQLSMLKAAVNVNIQTKVGDILIDYVCTVSSGTSSPVGNYFKYEIQLNIIDTDGDNVVNYCENNQIQKDYDLGNLKYLSFTPQKVLYNSSFTVSPKVNIGDHILKITTPNTMQLSQSNYCYLYLPKNSETLFLSKMVKDEYVIRATKAASSDKRNLFDNYYLKFTAEYASSYEFVVVDGLDEPNFVTFSNIYSSNLQISTINEVAEFENVPQFSFKIYTKLYPKPEIARNELTTISSDGKKYNTRVIGNNALRYQFYLNDADLAILNRYIDLCLPVNISNGNYSAVTSIDYSENAMETAVNLHQIDIVFIYAVSSTTLD